MKRLGLVSLMFVACSLLAGCPGSNRGGKGKPITIDGWYKPTPTDTYINDVAAELDVQPDIKPQACDTDADCNDGWFCHPDFNVCVECFEDGHCHGNALCIDLACVEMQECDFETSCPDGLVCDYELGLCVECITDQDCPKDYTCDDHLCTPPKPPCETDEDCPEGLICNDHVGQCVECLGDANCPEDEWCSIDSGECHDDLCDPGTAMCVSGGLKECIANGSGYGETLVCPSGTVCQDGECIPVQVCEPGESFCTTKTSYKVCIETGTEWKTIECPENAGCVDSDGHAQCIGGCEPICNEPPNWCGPDEASCGTMCSSCKPGFTCPGWAQGIPPGEYIPCEDTCSCEGKECGDNGCGESCGQCDAGFVCQVGQCVYAGYTCAEGFECILSCEAMPNEQCLGACIAATTPAQQNTLIQFMQCIADFCGGQVVPGCAQEVAKTACQQFATMCLECQPDCFGKECGSDGCGGSCGSCPDGFNCKNDKCIGLGDCEGILDCIQTTQAPPDISVPICMSQANPDAQGKFLELAACVQDTCGDFQPLSECYFASIQGPCETPYTECKECIPYCIGKECGVDGCGGWCGFCEEGYDCDNGQCTCIPNCDGKECGPDGCGNLCGKCAPGFSCTQWGKCDCTPNCIGKECGNDGCGGSCGFCNPDEEDCSENGNCIPFNCKPGMMECDGNVPLICAEDGEWFALAPCPVGLYCFDGQCLPWICEPGTTQCNGNGVSTCAPNGAGWLEPELCPPGTKCQAGQCIPVAGCGEIPNVGCCDGTTFMVCTEEGTITVDECGVAGCGWIPNWGYGCGGVGPDPNGFFQLACPGTCQPNCIDDNNQPKECGPDGCGEICGLCAPDNVCVDGLCEPFCIPNCAGKQCGTDECGGSCGVCDDNETCYQGKCMVPSSCKSMLDCAKECYLLGDQCFALCSQGAPPDTEAYMEFKDIWLCTTTLCLPNSNPNCFDAALLGTCYIEYLSCVSCTPDCGGNECGPDECGGSCGTCADGEECAAGECLPICVPNCTNKQCGANGCGGQCGICQPGYECDNGECIYICKPQCVGKECGPDTCGGFCGFCGPEEECSALDQCVLTSVCGDGFCEVDEGENCNNCAIDCGECPNGCDPTPFPGCGGCQCETCVCNMDAFCCEVQWDSICVEHCYECGGCCEPNCAGKKCGPDGCGGKCGTCPQDYACKNGFCEIVCQPDCDGKECGSDGCGGTCGTCDPAQTCKNSVCFSGKPCGELVQCAFDCVEISGAECLFGCLDEGTPEAQDEFFALTQCVLWQCGLNLDLNCLLSAIDNSCQEEFWQCQDCQADCTGKQCGPDGCGGTCGQCSDNYYCDNYKCKPICTPDCTGLECGSNGCGGSCGECDDDEECLSGKCSLVCQPNCSGKQCGDDGCGGLCGGCPPSFVCQNFKCVPTGPVCGDGECNYWDGEDCNNCPQDCGDCGDGCSPTQYPGCNGCPCEECVCAMDSYCCQTAWDSICVDLCKDCGGCGGCPPQCQGKECGPDGCGGSCGFCDPEYTCQAGTCIETCQTSCLGKQCGPDGCGGSCGSCPNGFKCSGQSVCVPVCEPNCAGKQCGPDGCNGLCGLCGPDEMCLGGQCELAWDCELLLNCLWDCPENDEVCTGECWDTASPEAQEQYIMIWECILEVCGPDPVDPCPSEAILYGACKDEFNECLDCTPQCTGKQCGSDGCGGDCGQCPPGYTCDQYGYCDCVPNCNGKDCGNDGCGGDCGQCPDGYQCNIFGSCVCLPNCINKECGTDGCGGLCGKCQVGFACQKGLCIEDCVPQCVGPDGQSKECGPDGCGQQCGFCPPGLSCTPQGKCTQTGPVCGDIICEADENCLTCPSDCGFCTGDCCESHDSVGCNDPDVTKCVCSIDFFCCVSNWDSICATQAENECGADCGCNPQCEGMECGPDGCGGQCGFCPPNAWCNADGQCIVACDPKCDGKQCGPDGCGDSCGTCPPGNQCNAMGQCLCVPDCWNKECGSDGCGGSCGECGQWQTCTGSGKCKFVTPLCGDNNCMDMIGEDCDSCPQDCGECCGNGTCEPAFLETCASCTADCGTCCGNNFCEAQFGETCETCPGDCGPCPAICGDGLCAEDKGESCKNCPQDCGLCPSPCGDGICDEDDNETCFSCPDDCGECEGSCCISNGSPGCENPKVQDCVCGMDPYCCNSTWDNLCANQADDCGSCNGDCCKSNNTPGCDDEDIESCVCAADDYCCFVKWDAGCAAMVNDFGCGDCQAPGCGDEKCDLMGGENCQTCPEDCGKCCGNGQCEEFYGEDCDSCPADCGQCPGEGSCCTPHDEPGCVDPQVEICVCQMDPFCCNNSWDSACASAADSCGSCNGNCCAGNPTPGCDDEEVEVCICNIFPSCCEDQWTAFCAQAVDMANCGECSCTPQCGGKECGEDGCGGSCGECGPDEECNDEGQCIGGGGLSCNQVLQCATGCGGDIACMLECNTQGSPVAQQLFQSLMSCVLQACFPPPPSVQCMIQSFMGQCNAEYQKCSAN